MIRILIYFFLLEPFTTSTVYGALTKFDNIRRVKCHEIGRKMIVVNLLHSTCHGFNTRFVDFKSRTL